MRQPRVLPAGRHFLVTNSFVIELSDHSLFSDILHRRLNEMTDRFSVTLLSYRLHPGGLELVVENRVHGELANAMEFLQSRFAREVNELLGRKGGLFVRRYRAKPIDGDDAIESCCAEMTSRARKEPTLTYGNERCPVRLALPPRFRGATARQWRRALASRIRKPSRTFSNRYCIADDEPSGLKLSSELRAILKRRRAASKRYRDRFVLAPFPVGTFPPSRHPRPVEEAHRGVRKTYSTSRSRGDAGS